jgi:hypothetical protein
MSIENSFKLRLASIAQNDYRVLDETEVWPLAVEMMQSLGSTDPELRDKLINRVLIQWSELYFDSQQLDSLLKIALDDQHLFLGLGEQETDSVFMRSFSSLAIACFVARHRERPYLTAQAANETLRKMLSYLGRERDPRGHVPDKGWAHAVAHAADALDELALCPELGKESLVDMLRVIRETVAGASVVFVDDEDERLVTAVLSVIQRQVLAKAEIIQWLSDFGSFELPPSYQEWLRKRTNIKHFMRSLYFRLLDHGLIESYEPVLGQTLQEISNRRIPPEYFK